MKERTYFCIDMKSFFASVECAERGLNPFETNLIVADESRGNGTICLAITPKMKSLGVRNRCRRYEIPKNIQYIMGADRSMNSMTVWMELQRYSPLQERNGRTDNFRFITPTQPQPPDFFGWLFFRLLRYEQTLQAAMLSLK